MIADILTPRERPIFQSYSSVMFMTACDPRPAAGGFLTDYLHWSFIFWINLPLGVVALGDDRPRAQAASRATTARTSST